MISAPEVQCCDAFAERRIKPTQRGTGYIRRAVLISLERVPKRRDALKTISEVL